MIDPDIPRISFTPPNLTHGTCCANCKHCTDASPYSWDDNEALCEKYNYYTGFTDKCDDFEMGNVGVYEEIDTTLRELDDD